MKSLDQFREKRQRVYEGFFSAKALFFTGLVIMPAFLFTPLTSLRIILFLFFWFLSWLAGKKSNPLFIIVIILGITLFNLIVPYGRVLFSISAFKVTVGALLGGIHRAVTFEGLIMLSRIAIRPDLKIPGFFGELTGETFRIFSVIMNQRNRITRINIMGDIDRLMLELSGDDRNNNNNGETGNGGETHQPVAACIFRTQPAGFVILAVVAILPWAAMLIMLKLG
jgi:heptaprenyl diphosphate synthase